MELEEDIKELELEVQTNNNSEVQQKLAILKAKYHKLSADKALAGLTRLKQAYLDRGEKTDKLLAGQIKTLQNEKAINVITNASGETITNPQEINKLLRSYYSLLYSSESFVTSESLSDFFDHIEIPSLSKETRAELDAPITINELSTAFDKLKGGKAPGPDGLPIDLYEIF